MILKPARNGIEFEFEIAIINCFEKSGLLSTGFYMKKLIYVTEAIYKS